MTVTHTIRFRWAIVAASFIACLATITAALLLDPHGRASDMVAFFRPHLAAASVMAVLATMWSRSRLLMACAVMLALANAYPLAVAAFPMASAAADANLRVMTANVLFDNPSKDRLRSLVASVSPDILVTQEAMFEWPEALAELEGFGHITGPELDKWNGVIVLSRHEMQASLVDAMPIPGRVVGGGRALRVVVQRPGGASPIVLYAIHAPTPRTKAGWEMRNLYLIALAKRIRQEPTGTNVLVAGDWNTPVWAKGYTSFLEASGLLASERSAWPSPTRIFTRWGVPAFLGTPIDHIAVSEGMAIRAHTVGPDFGSDHLPVIVDIKIP